MRHLSRINSEVDGFALVELLITAAVASVLLASISGIYIAVSQDWERSRGESEALVATSECCSVLSRYIEQAVGAVVINRTSGDNAICLQMPADTADGGIYTPVWDENSLNYRGGSWLIFYLSDSSGNYNRGGKILWTATMDWSNFPWSITPDSSWSLYYGDVTKGKIAPLKSVSFAIDESGLVPVVTITAVSSYKIGTTEKEIKLTRTAMLRNHVYGGG